MLALLAGASGVTAKNVVLSYNYTVGSGPFNVVAADVNGDGKLDLICANQGVYPTVGNTVTTTATVNATTLLHKVLGASAYSIIYSATDSDGNVVVSTTTIAVR